MKVLNESFVQVPWGKIALISFGNQQGTPVLLVHGSQDSAATFLPLIHLLPDNYYYVAIDMPGSGKSDALPIGTALTRFFGVVAIDMTIQHFGWKQFVYIGHSMGSEQGLFYNAIYPGKIKKIILLDAGPALQRLVIRSFPQFYKYYDNYYSNYSKYNYDDRVYSKSDALQAVMKARGMTEAQAEVILSRNLKEIAENKYRLSWDRREKNLVPTNYPPEYYYELFSNSPPTLYICANHSSASYYTKGKIIIDELITKLAKNVKNFLILNVDGTHDVHFMHPERFIKELSAFLEKDFDIKCKL